MTECEKIELAIRRTSERLKGQTPWDMGVTDAFDALADEIARMAQRYGETHHEAGSKYRFDRYVDSRLMAQGVTVSNATSSTDALEKAYAHLKSDGATEDEISRTTFRECDD